MGLEQPKATTPESTPIDHFNHAENSLLSTLGEIDSLDDGVVQGHESELMGLIEKLEGLNKPPSRHEHPV